jgi:hypothetical protein
MIVTGNRQHLIGTNDLHHLKYVMILYTDGSGTRTGQRTANIQPVSSERIYNAPVSSDYEYRVMPHGCSHASRQDIPQLAQAFLG